MSDEERPAKRICITLKKDIVEILRDFNNKLLSKLNYVTLIGDLLDRTIEVEEQVKVEPESSGSSSSSSSVNLKVQPVETTVFEEPKLDYPVGIEHHHNPFQNLGREKVTVYSKSENKRRDVIDGLVSDLTDPEWKTKVPFGLSTLTSYLVDKIRVRSIYSVELVGHFFYHPGGQFKQEDPEKKIEQVVIPCTPWTNAFNKSKYNGGWSHTNRHFWIVVVWTDTVTTPGWTRNYGEKWHDGEELRWNCKKVCCLCGKSPTNRSELTEVCEVLPELNSLTVPTAIGLQPVSALQFAAWLKT